MRLFEQLLIHNDCYVAGKIINPIGVMLHSTGAFNTALCRYVPGDDIIGRNKHGNHWDQSNQQWKMKFGKPLDKCAHAFIGQLADGSVATVQTLPWAMRGWHAGKSKGNNRYIGFEICEDHLCDGAYFAAVYREAVELVSYLCRLHGWDPMADGTIICHAEGYQRGVASNHGDVLHWFCLHGKSMDDFRADVVRTLQGEEEEDMAPRYNTVEEIRKAAEWALPTIRKMIDKGFISGGGKKDANGDPADMDLSMDMIRIFVSNNKAGVYG